MIIKIVKHLCDVDNGPAGGGQALTANPPAAPNAPIVITEAPSGEEGITRSSTPSPFGKISAKREPTAAELATEFKDDPSLTGDLTDVLPETKPAAEVKPKPAAKQPEVKPKAEPVVEPTAPPAKKQSITDGPIVPGAAAGAPKVRDYAGFSPEESRVLKAMSNEAFEYVSKVFKEKKELEKLKDASFLQHPEAYRLDPQFTKLQEDTTYFTKEMNHWQNQLIAIEEGKEWVPLTGWNADGTPIYGAPQKPTIPAKLQMQQLMNQCANAAQQSQANLQQMAGQYKQRIAADGVAIQEECKKRFGWCADPKLMEKTIDIPDVGPKSLKQLKDDLTSMFPVYERGTRGVDVAGHLFIALQIYAQKIRELEQSTQLAEVRTEEIARVEPSSAAKIVEEGKTINGVKEFVLDPSLGLS